MPLTEYSLEAILPSSEEVTQFSKKGTIWLAWLEPPLDNCLAALNHLPSNSIALKYYDV